MGNQESNRLGRSLWYSDHTHGSVFPGIYNHKRDGFVSDEVIAYAEELTKGIDV